MDPSTYPVNSNHANALANFADGLRVTNPILKYEQFYKVLEHSFSERNIVGNNALDKAVATYVTTFDSQFDECAVRRLRNVRNRCVHPRQANHINPQNFSAVEELRSTLPAMEGLARILIEHPPG